MAHKRRSNTLRIIAGRHRGRKLRFPDARGLRPTADRVRETLFNWLQAEIDGARCLDLFAGSGALGFEALSRGAAHVSMCDSSWTAVSGLRRNAALLQLQQRLRIHHQDARKLLAGAAPQSFDLVFCDPPFAAGLLVSSCALLEERGWLAENALIYLEQDSASPWRGLPDNWTLYRQGRAGQAAFRLMYRV